MPAPAIIGSAIANITSGQAAVSLLSGGKSILTGAAIGAGQTAAHSLVNPYSRAIGYFANRTRPNVVPDSEVLLGLWHSGRISSQDATNLFRANGIDWDGTRFPGTDLAWAWQQAVELAKPQWDFADYKKWFRQGRITLQTAIDKLSRRGLTGIADVNLWLQDRENLDISTIGQLFLLGLIDENEVNSLLLRIGVIGDDAVRLRSAWQVKPHLLETLTLLNRDLINVDSARGWMKSHGYVSISDQNKLLELAKVIPPPTDLIHFSVREVWSEDVVNSFGYDEEFPHEFAAWMKKHGLDWGEQITLDDGTQLPSLNWPVAYWRSHWRVMSPEQGYEALHRLRGNPDFPDTWRIPGIKPFTEDDLNRILKIADYPPAMRDWLRGISYRPLRLVDIRNARKFNVINTSEVTEQFLDRGYKDSDAVVATKLLESQIDAEKERPFKRKHQTALDNHAKLIISGYSIGVTDAAATKAALVDLGYKPETANLLVANADIEWSHNLIQLTMRRAKSDFMRGAVNSAQATTRLVASGLPQSKAQEWVSQWQIERGEPKIHFATAKVLDLYKRGLLTLSSTKERLENLGWDEPDAILNIMSAQQDISKAYGIAVEKAARKAKEAARETQRAIEESQRKIEQMQAVLRRQTPIGSMKRWLADDQITEEEFVSRFKAMGFPYSVTKEYFEEVLGYEPNETLAYEDAQKGDEEDEQIQEDLGEETTQEAQKLSSARADK